MTRTNFLPRRQLSPGRAWVWLASVALLVGCAPTEELAYVNLVSFTDQGDTFAPLEEKDAEELAGRRKQLDQIAGHLTEYFGTPDRPKWMEASAEGEAAPLVERMPREHLLLGAQVYQRNCLACHGATGDGNGPQAKHLRPRPRDYRLGVFKFVSGRRGSKPVREDLYRIVQQGAKGTSMPAFRWMPPEELRAVVDYVMALSYRGEIERELFFHIRDEIDAADPVERAAVDAAQAKIRKRWDAAEQGIVTPLTPQPEFTADSVAQGKAAFLTKGCSKCHGEDGRGRTQDNVGVDAWGHPTNAADLTSGMLHGGRRPLDVYRRIYSGINGTPMPAFDAALQSEPDTIWHMAHYVLHLAGRSPLRAAPAAVPPPESAAPSTTETSAASPETP